MNAPVKTPEAKQQVTVAQPTQATKPKLLDIMAAQYNMEPDKFAAAVKKTAMPANATTEEFAAFMMVAHEYGLNPFLRELFAFPKKGGGIVPMVSIDGWVNLVNKQPNLAGFEFEHHYDEDKKLAAVTCRMYRKDRTMPVVVTEYMIECFRNTEPWRNMPSRMLRHKALIQTARYCFGLSGIVDEDEANDIAGNKDVSGVKDITPPRPTREDFVIPVKQTFAEDVKQEGAEAVDPDTGEVTTAQAEAEGPADEEEAKTDEQEYGPFEARNDGRTAHANKVPRDKVPGHIRQMNLTEAWLDGWDDAAEEAKESATKDGKLV